MLVEVLSESSERYDRGDQFAHYQSLASLREYLLVSQARPRVERFVRNADGGWAYYEHSGPDAVVALPSLGVEMPLTEIYLDVPFPGEPGHSGSR